MGSEQDSSRTGTSLLQTTGSEAELVRLTDAVEEEVFAAHDREVPSQLIGRLVTDKLRRVDQVAYVRFASVYRQFKTLEELVNEAKAVIDAQRFDDPEQGRLFIEAQARDKAAEKNGSAAKKVKKSKASAVVSEVLDSE